jgi:sugar phosphate permease
VRFFILGLLTIGTMINYLDRTVLGIAAPLLREELAIDAVTMGIVFSAFSWTYAAMQIPGGIFLDRFGSKLTYFLSLTFWSLSTLLHGLATNLASLLAFRFALGVSEAPCFPTNGRVVATWFPQQERAFATGVYTVGEYVGLAFLRQLARVLQWHDVRAHRVAPLVGCDEPESREDACRGGDEHRRHPELICKRTRMQRARAAKRKQMEIAQIMTAHG